MTPQGAPQSISPVPFVTVENLVKHYRIGGIGRRRRFVKSVDGVSFSIREREVLGLVGESGCGKSTIARLLVRLIKADSGSAVIDGRDIASLEGEELRHFRRSMQLVFQDPLGALDPRMRLGTSLEAPLHQHGLGAAPARREMVLEMLEEVGLDPSFADRYPRQCSGGQLQRVVIARALLLHPRFLVCDEPTSALDASMRTQILNLLVALKQRFSLTLLMISHDLRVVRHISDRIAVMYLGQIVEIADTADLFVRPAHPYTQALIAASMLDGHKPGGEGDPLRGEAPSPLNPPDGCRFHARCPVAEARCAREPPELKPAGDNRLVRCHLSEPVIG